MIDCANTVNTLGGLEHSDRLYYTEAQKIWHSKTKRQERSEIDKRFAELWERLHDQEQLLQAAFRHIEALLKNQPCGSQIGKDSNVNLGSALCTTK